MRIVIQRVSQASVSIDGNVKSSIGAGLLILIGIEDLDDQEDIDFLCKKITQLRIFDDKNGVMNESVMEQKGEIMVISQFTLHASTKKGNRPSYLKAAKPETAIPLYEKFCSSLEQSAGTKVQTGVFGADMQVSLVNNGPVTIIIDSKHKE